VNPHQSAETIAVFACVALIAVNASGFVHVVKGSVSVGSLAFRARARLMDPRIELVVGKPMFPQDRNPAAARGIPYCVGESLDTCRRRTQRFRPFAFRGKKSSSIQGSMT
jgi:hypothetical protein